MRLTPNSYIDFARTIDNPLESAREILLEALVGSDLSKSVMNCHTQGVDSIVLFDRGDLGMVRFFIAHAYCNNLHQLYDENGHFTIGIHNHRYRIAKIPLSGPIINVRTEIVVPSYDGPKQPMYEYGFKSALKGEKMEAERYGLLDVRALEPEIITPGHVVVMDPSDLHTVTVPWGETVAWMVVEGPPVDIEPLIYSPRDDLTLSSDGLYLPMNIDESRRRIMETLETTLLR